MIIIITTLTVNLYHHFNENNDNYLRKEYIKSLTIELPEEIHEATEDDSLLAIKRGDTIFIMYN